jgi:predicted amidohydrolase YtcJ
VTTLYAGGRIVTGDPDEPPPAALVVDGERISFVGDLTGARAVAGATADVVDLSGGALLPGFVDAHTHLLMSGEAQLRAYLTDAPDLAAIRKRLTDWRGRNPDAPRVLGRGWLFSAVPGGRPTREMLDDDFPDVPVYLDANDYHSCWVNTAALAELGVTRDTPDPVGGRIVRDPEGEAIGHLEETAVQTLVWPFLADQASDADRDAALAAAVAAYTESGVTTAVDMALDAAALAAMQRAERSGTLDIRVVAHWLVPRPGGTAGHLAEVARAAELARTVRSAHLRVAGIKLIVDGVIDGCTAALLEPYADGSNAEPIWDLDALIPVVTAADAAGLQIAMHAIGDRAVRIALDALEHAAEENGPRPRRHRIEHLEYVDPADIPRLAALGVTASMQPVHADPAIMPNWLQQLGPARAGRGFAWPEYTAAGALLAFGTDAPTAPHAPLPNMFIANTRRSALDPGLPPYLPHFAVPLAEAVRHGTADAAQACGEDAALGRLRPGAFADLVVLDRDPFDSVAEELLDTRVARTVVGGRTVHG